MKLFVENSGYKRAGKRDSHVMTVGRKEEFIKSGVRIHSSAKLGAQASNIRKLLTKTLWYKEKEAGSSGEEEEETAR